MKILIAGDFCPYGRVKDALNNHSFNALFSDVKEVINKSSDYSIVNLECPILKTPSKSISKVGPALYTTPDAIDALKYMGFNCVTMANNHIYDYGETGLKDSISVCQNNGIDVVGVGDNSLDAQRVLYKKINDAIIAVINCCEHEFSIAGAEHSGANAFDLVNLFYNIKEARTKADYIIVIYHGGNEGWNLPTPSMQKHFRGIIDFGADAVICHHQHCMGGAEIYNGRPIVYGLGNFCFDWKKDERWCEGYMVCLEFEPQAISYEIIPYIQFGENNKIEILPKGAFDKKLKILNSIISNDWRLKEANEDYYNGSSKWYYDFVRPFASRILLALKNRHIIPRLYSKKWKLRLYSVINCESHREKFLYRLRNDIKNG